MNGSGAGYRTIAIARGHGPLSLAWHGLATVLQSLGRTVPPLLVRVAGADTLSAELEGLISATAPEAGNAMMTQSTGSVMPRPLQVADVQRVVAGDVGDAQFWVLLE